MANALSARLYFREGKREMDLILRYGGLLPVVGGDSDDCACANGTRTCTGMMGLFGGMMGNRASCPISPRS